MKYPLLTDAKIKGKKVLLRAGFDVPVEGGTVTDATRIEAIAPTMKAILKGGAALIVMAHQDRPKGVRVPEMSQKPLVPVLEKLLKTTVKFCDQCRGPEAKKAADSLKAGEVLLLENLRYEKDENSKVPAERDAFGKELASLADIYVNDAFTNCHRDHASMTSVPKLLPSYMGLQLAEEVENLSKVLDDPRRPVTLIVSGAKMETKIPVIEHFLNKGDDILLGGCIATTFIAARGFEVGTSKYEVEQVEKAQELMLEGEKVELADIHVPRDVVVASEASDTAEKLDLPLENIIGDMMILDVGKVTIERYRKIIEKSGTIIWNGPLGMYELNRFSHATKRLAEAIHEATAKGAISIIGGGDTIDFHIKYKYPMDCYTFVSTGGGAMLDFISGKELPALKALAKK
ncbi:MAG: phosphoglycerate kinase [Candidatus Peribacteraceae bacterium]|nr:phosphoglycerate kinase [Candidatus Peribacteraceae bacterium]MDD5075016.1 phosphoglycerate kinase [Candidatus Peribacteraceae bacterium]